MAQADDARRREQRGREPEDGLARHQRRGRRGPATAARVKAAIAPRLRSATTSRARCGTGAQSTLGLVIEDVANPFYSAIAQAVEDAARERGHMLIIGSCEEDPERERELVLRAAAPLGRRAAIVPAGGEHRWLQPSRRGDAGRLPRPPAAAASRPTPCCSTTSAARARRSSTCSRTATADRVRRGRRGAVHRRASASPATAPRSRDAGLRHRRRAWSGSARTTPTRPSAPSRELLALPADHRPTALFTANNRHTVGALRALRDGDGTIALVGFDDFELADLLRCPTVVRHDARRDRAAGRRAGVRAAGRRRRAAAADRRVRPSSSPGAPGSCAP